MSKDNFNFSNGFLLGLLLTGFVFGITFAILESDIQMSQEVGNDICLHLTNQTSVASVDSEGRFVCETPSYDETTYIVVRKTGEARTG